MQTPILWTILWIKIFCRPPNSKAENEIRLNETSLLRHSRELQVWLPTYWAYHRSVYRGRGPHVSCRPYASRKVQLFYRRNPSFGLETGHRHVHWERQSVRDAERDPDTCHTDRLCNDRLYNGHLCCSDRLCSDHGGSCLAHHAVRTVKSLQLETW